MNKKALTLIEIIVSIVILALIIGGMANMFISGKRWVLHARSRMSGGELGKYFLDPLAQDVRQDQWASGNNCLTGGVNCPAQETIENISYTPSYNVSDLNLSPNSSLKKVITTISWQEINPN